RRRPEAAGRAPLLPRAGLQHGRGPHDPGERTMSNIKVALAGAGAFGIKHLDAIANIDGVEVVSLVSRDLEKTRAVAAKSGIGHATTDLRSEERRVGKEW